MRVKWRKRLYQVYCIVLERAQGPTLLHCNYADTFFTVAFGSVLADCDTQVPQRSTLNQHGHFKTLLEDKPGLHTRPFVMFPTYQRTPRVLKQTPIVQHGMIRNKEQVGCLFPCIRPPRDAFEAWTIYFAFVIQASTISVWVAINVQLEQMFMSAGAFLSPYCLHDRAGRSQTVPFWIDTDGKLPNC